mmetsp:Transcript_14979/g.34609  ORF Transcript_14979/g.34609 Transcript_14979/m.34609 type:complete len:241 (+) Transcript_14979:1074-1796(+)
MFNGIHNVSFSSDTIFLPRRNYEALVKFLERVWLFLWFLGANQINFAKGSLSENPMNVQIFEKDGFVDPRGRKREGFSKPLNISDYTFDILARKNPTCCVLLHYCRVRRNVIWVPLHGLVAKIISRLESENLPVLVCYHDTSAPDYPQLLTIGFASFTEFISLLVTLLYDQVCQTIHFVIVKFGATDKDGKTSQKSLPHGTIHNLLEWSQSHLERIAGNTKTGTIRHGRHVGQLGLSGKQ